MIVTVYGTRLNQEATDYFPKIEGISPSIPPKPREFLRQAKESMHAPAGAIMLACSAVDAMLKEKGYKDGHLFPRIEQAVKDHVITKEMAKWAHQIRLDANDQRHADEDATLPDAKSAQRILEFAGALAQFLFVLPALVDEGLKKTSGVSIAK